MPSKNFVFKCHRDGSNVHSVNSIDFHHYGSFCTAGSDGTFSWWDKEARYVRIFILDFCLFYFCLFHHSSLHSMTVSHMVCFLFSFFLSLSFFLIVSIIITFFH